MLTRLSCLALAFLSLLAAEPKTGNAELKKTFAKIPLHFESLPGAEAFLARGAGYSFEVSPRQARLHIKSSAVSMRLVGANPAATIAPVDPLPGRVNYLFGNDPALWRRDIPTYEKVQVTGVYPGVDLVYYGNQKQLEYDLVLAPGADPTPLILEFEGAESLRLTPDGALILQTKDGEIRWRRPEVYQQKNGQRIPVKSAYTLRSPRQVGFALDPHDPSLPLTIDPVLEYSTVIGGDSGGSDFLSAIRVDSLGQAYVVGYSNRNDFPLQNALPGGNQGGIDVVVTKLNTAGTAVVFSTFLGGAGDDYGAAIALDAANPPNVYIAGYTYSSNFPVVGGPQSVLGGNADAFIAKLSANGNQILYSSYHGGDAFDRATAIGVHSATGTAYIAGYTGSTNFPLANALQTTKGSSTDGFVAKYSAAGNSRLFSTLLGGNNNDFLWGLAIDPNGNAYVAGESFSTNYPTTNPIQAAKGGDWDCVVTALNPTGSARIYSTYIGGRGADTCLAIALDSSNAAYVTGLTRSDNFPLRANPQNQYLVGEKSAFATKINPQGNQLLYSTYLGYYSQNLGRAIAVDPLGRAYIAGDTYNDIDFSPIGNVFGRKSGTPFTFSASSDGGATFEVRGTAAVGNVAQSGIVRGLEAEGVLNVLAYQSATSLFAGSLDGPSLYRSTNEGVSWTATGTGLTGSIQSIAFSGASTVWVGTNDSVFVSTNSGTSWTARTTGLPATRTAFAIAISPADPNLLLVALGSDGLFRSTNAGVSWSSAVTGLVNRTINTILFNPTTPTEALVGTSSGLFRSVDSGQTWAAYGTGLPSGSVTRLIRYPATPTLLFAIAGGRVATSSNGGLTWTPIVFPAPNPRRIAVNPTNPQLLLVSTNGNGVWRTTNQGQTWTLVTNPDDLAFDVAFNPSVSTAAVLSVDANIDGYVTRLSADGSQIEFITTLGTVENDAASGVATDSAGNIYVTGWTDGPGFPTTAGTLPRKARPRDGFVVKIAPEATPECTFQISPPTSLFFPFSAAQFGNPFTVIAPGQCRWDATSSAPWLLILNGYGEGSGEARFSVTPNTSATNRSATLTVAGTPFTITQSGTTCESNQSIANNVTSVGAAGGTQNPNLTIPAGCPWTARANSSWVTLPVTSGTGTATVAVTVAPNPGFNSRATRVDIGPRNYTITQAGSCTATFSPSTFLDLDATAQSGRQVDLIIGAACAWSILPSSNITITSSLSGTGPATITYNITANPDPIERSSGITVGSTTYAIFQNPATCTHTFDTTARNLSAIRADGFFDVSTQPNCVRAAVSNQSWLTLTGNDGYGNGRISFSTSPNPSNAPRSALITLGGQSITVNQAGIPPAVPAVYTPAPANGSGLTQSFTFNFADANGFADLNVLNVLINKDLNGFNACYIAYVRPANTIFLVPDNGDGLLPGVVPGVTGSASNSQCTINGIGSSMTTSGNTLTLVLNITFTAPFAGNKVVYQAARDVAGNNSGWVSLGTWNVPSSAVLAPNVPTVTSMTPARWAGSRQTFAFTFTDPNGAADLNVLNILVNNALDGRAACYIAYVRPANTLYVVPDNGDGLVVPGLVPDGGAGVTENSQCRIFAQGSSVTTSGNNLTLTLNMEFKPAAGRDRLFYMAARDLAGNNSNWQVVGSVSVQ